MKNTFIGVLIVLGALIAYFVIFGEGEKVEVEVNVLEEISEYGYEIKDNDTELFKSLYEELKILLNEEEIDYLKYAETISKMFIVDLYTIDNKITKNDVGGTEFIYSLFLDNYELNVENELYKYVENDIYGDRIQKLPVVSNVSISSSEKVVYDSEEVKDDEAFKISLTWDYEEDLGYEDSTELYLVHELDKLVIVEMN